MFFQSDKNLSITIPQLQSISLSISFITSVSPDSFAHSTNTDIALLNFLNPIFDGKTSPSKSTSLKYSVKILMKELVYFSIFEYSDFVQVASSFDCGPIQYYIDNPFSELFTYLFLIDIKSILFFNSWSNTSRV